MAYITGIGGSGALSYFTDNNGMPRPAFGDAMWAWPGNAGRWNSGNWQADFDTLISIRAGQGFTILYCKPIGTLQSNNIDDFGQTFDGLFPFQGGTPATGVSGAVPSSGLTEAFWARIDYMLNSALNAGVTIFLNATGYSTDFDTGSTWASGLSGAEIQAYGAALGGRYQNQPNLMWSIEDDYFGGATDSKLNSFLTGLRAAGDTHPITIENFPESTSRNDISSAGPAALPWGTSHAQFNFVYSYNEEYYGVEEAYKESSPMLVMSADGFFYLGSAGTYFDNYDRSMRQCAWWALAAGARGHMRGSDLIWQYQSNALTEAAGEWFFANNHANIAAFFGALPNWHLLVPDTASTFVTGGRGTRATAISTSTGPLYEPAFTSSYVAASLTADGTCALLYLPNHTTITVNQSKLAAGYGAKWVDPVTCATTVAATGATYNSTAQGTNSAGGPDWVLAMTTPPYATWAVP